MSIPILFIHRADEEHLGACLQQARISNPASRVILIGTKENAKHCPPQAEHHLIQDYGQSAQLFANFYRHLSSNDYTYNLFCFQRWFILRDFLRRNHISQCYYLDSDVLLYADVNPPEYQDLLLEFSWTTFCDVATLDRFCHYMIAHFTDPRLLQKLLDYSKEIGNVPLSDMVTCIHYHNYFLRKNSTFGLFGDSFFDHNLSCPLAPSCPAIEMLEGKKRMYLVNGTLACKVLGTDRYLKANSLHFQGSAKAYIPFFLSPNLPRHASPHSFDYGSCQWLPVPE
ncbi:hypothetical protein [Brevibacillus brevis]|uniref:Mannosyltransferase n=1 Tax=Brevibacillus brevis TaxID=1393 RepID=A0ABY9T971_BREBE|nr:hypothetical protein [Brevibacillus brevis]WNC16640.1 hypothetical protein RGB73_10085 [Brevibacillus brevis]